MTWRRGEAGSTLIDPPKDAPVPDFTNGKERDNRHVLYRIMISLFSIFLLTRILFTFAWGVLTGMTKVQSHNGCLVTYYSEKAAMAFQVRHNSRTKCTLKSKKTLVLALLNHEQL